jgi:hypothetical protein
MFIKRSITNDGILYDASAVSVSDINILPSTLIFSVSSDLNSITVTTPESSFPTIPVGTYTLSQSTSLASTTCGN